MCPPGTSAVADANDAEKLAFSKHGTNASKSTRICVHGGRCPVGRRYIATEMHATILCASRLAQRNPETRDDERKNTKNKKRRPIDSLTP